MNIAIDTTKPIKIVRLPRPVQTAEEIEADRQACIRALARFKRA